MNLRSYWVGVSAAFGVGLGVGAAAYGIFRNHELEIEYRERTASFIRAMELARAQNPLVVEMPSEILETIPQTATGEVGEVPVPQGGIKVKDIEQFTPEAKNPYHEAVDEPAASWTYLEEEDYHDDDGRFKGRIIIMPSDDGKPAFVEDDIEINDWEQKIGPSILRDFYVMVPVDVVPAVLYVRNNLTETDYEVIREIP